MYVRLQFETGSTNLPQNRHAYALRPGIDCIKVKTPKKIMVSSLGENDFCELEEDIRTVSRLELFASARILQEQRSRTRKTVMRSSFGGVLCTLETRLTVTEKHR